MSLYIWLVIAIIAIVAEMATPSALVSIWFAVGALFAAFAAYLGAGVISEILAFVGVSALSFIVFRPLITKYIQHQSINTNVDRLIGYKGRLSESISAEKWGSIEISGLRYSVSSIDQMPIDKDEWVKVVSLKGARLIVEKDKEGV